MKPIIGLLMFSICMLLPAFSMMNSLSRGKNPLRAETETQPTNPYTTPT